MQTVTQFAGHLDSVRAGIAQELARHWSELGNVKAEPRSAFRLRASSTKPAAAGYAPALSTAKSALRPLSPAGRTSMRKTRSYRGRR